MPYHKDNFQDHFSKESVTRKAMDADWYGENVTFDELAAGVTTYKYPELISELFEKVDSALSVDVKDKIKARKIKYNPFGLGVFIFDRAAMSMYRLHEYYSPTHSKKVEPEQVYERHPKHYLKADHTEVIKRWEQKPDGRPKVRTNSKNVFAYFPEVPKDRLAVELFLSGDAPAAVSAKNMLYSCISALVIAKLLMKARIKVRINIVFGSATNSEGTEYYGCLVPIKDYNEPLDENLIALMGSDPRFMRFDAFKGVVAAFDYFHKRTPFGYGYAVNAKKLHGLFENSGWTAANSKAQNRYYFGGTFTEKDCLRDIQLTIDDIAKKFYKT